ncbi:hypothetical protein BHY_1166 (plasmid) [Borrelia nietonii YOR]|uniref:Uncharacterized protein n=2 Tax=Borrelia TaxID=138 RepID=W5SAX9_9SPIR|nr:MULTISPECIES: hypothetical protein [Borrelia]AHH04117.1 hypothetical protein BHY_1166 [Borrelia nietonii YOR]AHH14696.1 hypothetical protein BHW_0122301 [Borrelia hermsii MTW]UPA09753.1 hypothetical protein bhYOR_001057 [Borrelia nietonii YOR]
MKIFYVGIHALFIFMLGCSQNTQRELDKIASHESAISNVFGVADKKLEEQQRLEEQKKQAPYNSLIGRLNDYIEKFRKLWFITGLESDTGEFFFTAKK